MKVKVLSWNIWHGQDMKGVIEFLRKSEADIIGLQEVLEFENDKNENQAKIIAHELGYNFVYFPAFKTDRKSPVFIQGNAILTRHEIIKSENNLLSDMSSYQGGGETEPRVAGEVKLKIKNEELRVFVTHLAYSHKLQPSNLRDLQTDKLLSFIDGDKTILMGDFNVTPDSDVIKKVSQIMNDVGQKNGGPTWSIVKRIYKGFAVDFNYRIDYIFTSKDLKIENYQVEKLLASDHLPIFAVIES
jgi:endonuclease/exonuclease/phosphatase family metal-dependent hydrolase